MDVGTFWQAVEADLSFARGAAVNDDGEKPPSFKSPALPRMLTIRDQTERTVEQVVAEYDVTAQGGLRSALAAGLVFAANGTMLVDCILDMLARLRAGVMCGDVTPGVYDAILAETQQYEALLLDIAWRPERRDVFRFDAD